MHALSRGRAPSQWEVERAKQLAAEEFKTHGAQIERKTEHFVRERLEPEMTVSAAEVRRVAELPKQ